MLTLPGGLELVPGERVELSFALPRPDGPDLPVARRAVVRWASELLPDLIGVAFDEPLAPAEAALVDGLLP